jgi:hypothetical protein
LPLARIDLYERQAERLVEQMKQSSDSTER